MNYENNSIIKSNYSYKKKFFFNSLMPIEKSRASKLFGKWKNGLRITGKEPQANSFFICQWNSQNIFFPKTVVNIISLGGFSKCENSIFPIPSHHNFEIFDDQKMKSVHLKPNSFWGFLLNMQKIR